MNLVRYMTLLPGPLLLLVAWASFGGRVVDDAYISLTYAGHLVDGDGLVFHPALPVSEGYSNLLWTLLLAGGLALGFSGPTVAVGLGLLCAAATLVVVGHKVGGWRGTVVGVVSAMSPIFGFWAGQGLEGSLVALLLAVGLLYLERPVAWLAFGLLAITRVEGVFYGLVPVAAAIVAAYRGERKFPLWGPLLWLLPFAAQLAFRFWFYGSLLPSTVVAKVRTGGDSIRLGLHWLGGIVSLEPMVAVAFVGAVVALLLQWPRKPRVAEGWVLITVLGIMAYAVVVGGDWMMNLRWLQPAIPLVWYAAARVILRPRWFAVLAGLGLVLAARAGVKDGHDPARPRHWEAVIPTFLGGPEPVSLHPVHLFVLQELHREEVVLMPDMGQVSWMTGNPVLDPQGLTWRTVAEAIRHGHSRNAAYFESVARIQSQIRELSPRIIAIPMGRQGPSGPVGEALLGSADVSAPPWFAEEWHAWRELPQGAGVLRYYLRKSLDPAPVGEELLARYALALARVPTLAPVQTRHAALLRSLGRSDDADAARVDERASDPEEVWTRKPNLAPRPRRGPPPR